MIAPIRKKLLQKICSVLSRRFTIDVQISDFSVRWNKINFDELLFLTNSRGIFINQLTIKLAWRAGPKFVLYFKQIQFRQNKIEASSVEQMHSETIPMHLLDLYRKFRKLLLRISSGRLTKYCLIRIDQLQTYNRRNGVILIIRDFVYNYPRISFTVNPTITADHNGYDFQGLLKSQSFSYVLKPIVPSQSSKILFKKSIGKILLKPDQVHLYNFTTKMVIIQDAICTAPLTLNRIKSSIRVDVYKNQLNLSNSSSVQCDGILLCPRYTYDSNDEDFLSLSLFIDIKPESIIRLIPNLKVPQLNQLRSSGSLRIRIMFAVLRSDPLSYNFKIDYDDEGFEIETPGIELSYLNDKFHFHQKNQNEEANKRSIAVGVGTHLGQSLAAEIIQFTEDPNFYEHHGFDAYFMGRALAINLAKRQFIKGASTITMQMVKNLYLDHDKNLVRKVEEMILTLLIENYFKIPKERILEIYLQIIQFGPNTYGLQDASHFFYGKSVNELTLMQIIVLSYIIPRPKFFLEAVQLQSDQLDKKLSSHINFYYPKMAYKLKMKEINIPTDMVCFREEIGNLRLRYLSL